MELDVALILQLVECLGNVQACLAKYACQAFHLYAYSLGSLHVVASHPNELRYASLYALWGVVPYGMALHLRLAADEVKQVYGEDLVFCEFAEKVLLVNHECGAATFCNVVALECRVLAEQRVGFHCEWCLDLFGERV